MVVRSGYISIHIAHVYHIHALYHRFQPILVTHRSYIHTHQFISLFLCLDFLGLHRWHADKFGQNESWAHPLNAQDVCNTGSKWEGVLWGTVHSLSIWDWLPHLHVNVPNKKKTDTVPSTHQGHIVSYHTFGLQKSYIAIKIKALFYSKLPLCVWL